MIVYYTSWCSVFGFQDPVTYMRKDAGVSIAISQKRFALVDFLLLQSRILIQVSHILLVVMHLRMDAY